MNLVRVLFVFSISFQSQFAWSHGGGQHHHHDSNKILEISPETVELSQENLRELMDQAHEALESEDLRAGFFRRWKDKFNFNRIGMNAYRWYNMNKQHPAVANAGANITVMLLGSHAIETVGGLALASSAVASGDLGVTEMLLTTVGITITVPGLDPLCLVLVGAYGKWPNGMNKLLTKPRVLLMKGVDFANGLMGIEKGWWDNKWFEWRNRRFDRRMDRLSRRTLIENFDGKPVYTLYDINGEELAKLGFAPANEREMGLLYVDLPAYRPEGYRKALNRAVQPFGLNIRNWVNEIYVATEKDTVGELKHRPYVTEVFYSPINGAKITTRPLAFSVPMSCEQALVGISDPRMLRPTAR